MISYYVWNREIDSCQINADLDQILKSFVHVYVKGYQSFFIAENNLYM